MKTQKIDNMWRGWFIGDFEPSVLKTKEFEVGLLTHKKGEVWPEHYHIIASEYNVLIREMDRNIKMKFRTNTEMKYDIVIL